MKVYPKWNFLKSTSSEKIKGLLNNYKSEFSISGISISGFNKRIRSQN